MNGVLRKISTKLVAARRGIKKRDLLPSASTRPQGIPNMIAEITIFIVSQKPIKRRGPYSTNIEKSIAI